jgi:hypothetical protein
MEAAWRETATIASLLHKLGLRVTNFSSIILTRNRLQLFLSFIILFLLNKSHIKSIFSRRDYCIYEPFSLHPHQFDKYTFFPFSSKSFLSNSFLSSFFIQIKSVYSSEGADYLFFFLASAFASDKVRLARLLSELLEFLILGIVPFG